MTNSFAKSALLVIAALVCSLYVSLAAAVPVRLVKRDVWAPPVLEPSEGTVWFVGDRRNVTWDTSDLPAQVTNENGMIVLRNTNGFLQGPGGLGEPLATNFSMYLGSFEVEVPDVPAGEDYQIVLFGDSGNESPFFTIATSIIAF